MALKLENVSSVRGAPMGRQNWLPDDQEEPIRLYLTALKWVDGDYDQGGAYWGNSGLYNGTYTRIYCAHGHDSSGSPVRVFVRAAHRTAARELVLEILPKATIKKVQGDPWQ
jgi:hypothetical protein